MAFYQKLILPKMTHLVCGASALRRQREKLIPRAYGNVLEIGSGSGLNLPYYDRGKVTRIWGLDPSSEMLAMAGQKAAEIRIAVEFLTAPCEHIPLEDNCVDTIVTTYTLCSIGDPLQAFREMKRVLRPDGRLLFCEHGLPRDPGLRLLQQFLDPIWKRAAGGCRLNRDIPSLINRGGFQIMELRTGYISSFRLASFNYLGMALALGLESRPLV